MAKVEVVKSLKRQIFKKFKGEAHKVIDLLESLEQSPTKGKPLGNVLGFTIKELKYKGFRFYFIVDRFNINVLSKEELVDLLMRFVRMSDKKSQQKTIGEIRRILIKIGPHGFE
jgi:hypothetical protein